MHVNDCTLIKGGRETVAASENSPANLYIVEARATSMDIIGGDQIGQVNDELTRTKVLAEFAKSLECTALRPRDE
jgi:hypothetical protein